jgi:uncharacterized membrane protein
MRWIGLALLVILHSVAPIAHAGPESSARDGEIAGISGPSEVIVHPNETVSTYITLHNLVTVNQEFTISVASVPSVLNTENLPLSEVLVPNHLKQMVFGISADKNAPYMTHEVEFHVTSDYDETYSQSVWMNVTVAPYSNLKFGSENLTTLTVDELVRTGVAVNITNNASLPDNVTFDLYSPSGWNWGWTIDSNQEGNAYLDLDPDSLAYVYFWVDIPAVENGMPLAGTGPRFTLTAISGLDKAMTSWSFDLHMNDKRNVSIDEVGEDIELAPGENGRMLVSVRNVGNTPNRLNITLQGLDEQGENLLGYATSDRFNYSGWTVALFGGLEDVILQPNESRTVEIGIQSPNIFAGELNVELQVFAKGAQELTKTTRVKASINRTVGAILSFTQEGCSMLLVGEPCSSTLTVENGGNSYNTFRLRLNDVSDEFNASLAQESLLVQVGQQKIFSDVFINVTEGTLAFTQGEVIVELLGDGLTVLDSVSMPVKAAPVVKWSLGNVVEDINSKNRLSISFEVCNNGNAIDGFVVQLQSSHSVPMGLIPPEGAVYEDDTEYPRSYQLNGVPLESNLTIRAWIDLPKDQTTNGTVFINTTITSIFAPEGQMFVHTSEGDYIGTPWRVLEETDEGTDWGQIAATSWAYTKAWSGVIFAIIFSGLIIYKALTDRQRRLENDAILPYQQVESNASDWIQKFETAPASPTEQVVVARAPEVTKESFESVFRQQAGTTTPAAAPVDEKLREAATLVLDARTTQVSMEKADELLGDIQAKGVAQPHPLNQKLEPQDHSSALTVRQDPNNVMPNPPVKPADVTHVPLPVVIQEHDDDLEF